MPFVEGETLDVRMRRKGLELWETLAIAAQVADALADAHAAGIIQMCEATADVDGVLDRFFRLAFVSVLSQNHRFNAGHIAVFVGRIGLQVTVNYV